jgi:hypothetical protein
MGELKRRVDKLELSDGEHACLEEIAGPEGAFVVYGKRSKECSVKDRRGSLGSPARDQRQNQRIGFS